MKRVPLQEVAPGMVLVKPVTGGGLCGRRA